MKNSDIHNDIQQYFTQGDNNNMVLVFGEPSCSFNNFNYTDTLILDDPNVDKQSYLFLYNNKEIKCYVSGRVIQKIHIDQDQITSIARYCHDDDEKYNQKHTLVINREGFHTLYTINNPDSNNGKQKDSVLIREKYLFEDYYYSSKAPYRFNQTNYVIHYQSHPHIFISVNDTMIKVNNVQDSSKKLHILNYQVISLRVIDKTNNYALCLENTSSRVHGLLMLDFNKLLNEGTLGVTHLSEYDVGEDTPILNFPSQQRIGFKNQINKFVMIPYLHSNQTRLIGKSSLSSYNETLLDVEIGQYNVILNSSNELISWTLFNAQLYRRESVQKNLIDLSMYSKISYTQENLCLMFNVKSLDAQKQIKDNGQYFPQELMETNDPNQKTQTQLYSLFEIEMVAIKITDYDKIEYRKFQFPNLRDFEMAFSSDFNIMLCIIGGKKVIVYESQLINADSCEIQWKPLRVFIDYPFYLESYNWMQISSQPHFISPNFQYYLRFSKSKCYFSINDIKTGNSLYNFGDDIITAQDYSQARQASNRFIWIDDQKFKVINNYGIEIVYELNATKQTSPAPQFNLKIHGYNVWNMFNDPFIQQDTKEWRVVFHLKQYDKILQEESYDLIRALKYKYQRYKSDTYLRNFQDSIEKNELIYKLDWNKQIVLQSFTYLHWQLIKDIEQQQVTIDDLSNEQLQGLIYNIFPKGKTFIHLLSKQISIIEQIFARCHNQDGIIYHIPILPDFDGQTIFSTVYKEQKENKENQIVTSSDRKQILNIFQYLKFYGIDHHSKCIQKYYHEIISSKNQIALDYLESRFIQTDQLEKLNKGIIKNNQFLISSPILHSEQLQKYQNEATQDYKMIKVELLDIPSVYHYNDENFQKIFQEINKISTYDIFNNKAIQAIIDLNYPIVRKAILFTLIFPFIIFHVLFVAYTNNVYEKRMENEQYKEANIIMGAIILFFSAYFLYCELRQFSYIKFNYIKSFWNYIDILAPCTVIVQQSFQFADLQGHYIDPELNRVFLAVSTLLMWTKFLSIFRVFETTNYLIRTIYEVVYDMGVFLFVLLITVIGFGDAFLRLSEGNDNDNKFIESFIPAVAYAYSMILGGYDTTEFGEVAQPLVWIFWVLCTVLDMIVMLNLLIAIISATFERVNENQKGASYQEMACIIAENYFLIPEWQRESYLEKDRFILYATDVAKENQVIDENEKRFDQLSEKVSNIQVSMNKLQQMIEIKEKAKEQKQDEYNQQIMKRIGEIKLHQLTTNTGPKEEIKVTCYSQPLTKMILAEIQKESNGEMYKFWNCAAKRFVKCQRQYPQLYSEELQEIVYHCNEKNCNFDFCEKCYEEYPDAHNHRLVKMEFQQLLELNKSRYIDGWICNAKQFRRCRRSDNLDNGEIFEELYHSKNNFDLCIDCAELYKVEDIRQINEMNEQGNMSEESAEEEEEKDQNLMECEEIELYQKQANPRSSQEDKDEDSEEDEDEVKEYFNVYDKDDDEQEEGDDEEVEDEYENSPEELQRKTELINKNNGKDNDDQIQENIQQLSANLTIINNMAQNYEKQFKSQNDQQELLNEKLAKQENQINQLFILMNAMMEKLDQIPNKIHNNGNNIQFYPKDDNNQTLDSQQQQEMKQQEDNGKFIFKRKLPIIQ